MCGIAGIAGSSGSPAPREAQLLAMCRTLIHRGPDDEGVAIRGAVGLGMRRLSVIDIAGGTQPMANPDGSRIVVCNGEIYNFRELRADLESRGHAFRTQSDTEVLLHAHAEWGEGMLSRLNGMFGLALLDIQAKKLLLARDAFGVKPLYWSRVGEQLIFGSEIQAILASEIVPRSLDLAALGDFLAWEYVPGTATLFENVRRLAPGSALRFDLDSGHLEVFEYTDLPDGPEDEDADEGAWLERIEAALDTAVQRQLVSDVPLGAFLSGGVDSSLIVSAMGDAHAFSIGFDDPSYNELPWARRAARHLGVTLSERVLEARIGDLFERLVDHFDDPIGDFSIFPTYLVSQLAREHVTVALSGDGGDELFGGYESHLAQSIWRQYRRIPAFLRKSVVETTVRQLRPQPQKKGIINQALRFVEGLEHDQALEHTRWRAFMGDGLRQALFTPEAADATEAPAGAHLLKLFEKAGSRDAVNRGLYVDLRSYLCDNILAKVDRTSMAVSLETRVPYLDPDLVNLAFRIPGRFKVSGGRTKRILKTLAARRIPHECAYRPKEGFSIPIKHWLGTELAPRVDHLLAPERLREQGIFDLGTVARLRSEHAAGAANHSHMIWSLVVFQAWADRWLAGGGSPP
jgi:asparagine synthase (glutamine-hydrolysing)